MYDVYVLQLGGLVVLLTLGSFFLSENVGDVFHQKLVGFYVSCCKDAHLIAADILHLQGLVMVGWGL